MTQKRKLAKDFDKSTLVLYGSTYAVSSLSKTMQGHCTLHGLCQKLVDSTAGMNSDSYSDKERSDRVCQVWQQLMSDQWTRPGEGRVKASELKAEIADKEKMLEDMDLKLKDAMALIDKLTKSKDK